MATFSIALSGLTAASSALDITSNNIANADTIGFKSSQAEFADVYSSGAVNLNTSTAGEGVQLIVLRAAVHAGRHHDTSSPLDMAISGNGFFTLDSPSGNVYTRNGEFTEDQNGNVTTATGQFLQVYPPLANGGFNTGALQNLNLNTAQSAPQATSTGERDLEPAVRTTRCRPRRRSIRPTPTPTASRPRRPSTTRSGTPIRRPSTSRRPRRPGTWDVNMTVNGTVVGSHPANPDVLELRRHPDDTGQRQPRRSRGFTPADGAPPMNMTFNFGQTTQYGTQFGVTSITQNGYTTGQLSTVSVDSTGVVSAVYTNGRSTQLGQLAIANFPNPQGLQQLGDTNWAQTFSSGTVVQGTAGSAGFGTVQSSALESSNVDLTTELVNMITEQRAFQANAQVITTADQMSQTVIGIATNG